MSNLKNSFKVFKQPDDRNKWKNQIEFVSVMEGIEENMRIKLVSALDFLEKELGSGFLKTSKSDHPVMQKISNRADWQIHELIQFADTLQILKRNDSNYKKLIKKLLPLEKSISEGIPFIEIAESFIKVKFKVYFLEEPNTGKSPDIKITNPENNDNFFIEVSMVNNRDENNAITENYRFLHHQFISVIPLYQYAAVQKTIFSKDESTEIQKIISDAKKQVQATQGLVSYSDKRFEFILAPHNKVEEFHKICEQRNTIQNEVRGLSLNFDETKRILSKLDRKAGQIPFDSNGIIYLKVNPLFFMTTDISGLIVRLQDYISRKFTNILGVVLYSKILNNIRKEVFEEFDKHVFSIQMFGGVMCRELLFIYNYNCDLKLSDKTIQKIYSTFKKKEEKI